MAVRDTSPVIGDETTEEYRAALKAAMRALGVKRSESETSGDITLGQLQDPPQGERTTWRLFEKGARLRLGVAARAAHALDAHARRKNIVVPELDELIRLVHQIGDIEIYPGEWYVAPDEDERDRKSSIATALAQRLVSAGAISPARNNEFWKLLFDALIAGDVDIPRVSCCQLRAMREEPGRPNGEMRVHASTTGKRKPQSYGWVAPLGNGCIYTVNYRLFRITERGRQY